MSDGPQGIVIRPRDLMLMRGLYECRVMTLAHIAALHFGERAPAAKVRVQKLKRAGFIATRKRHVSEPAVHYLTSLGLTLLLQRAHLGDYPQLSRTQMEKRGRVSDATIRHELQVMDVKAAFHTAIRRAPNLELLQFSTWPMLHQFQAIRPDGQSTVVKPDGFIQLRQIVSTGAQTHHSFFLELDRGSEVQEILAIRAHCYRDYLTAGGFAVRHGLGVEDFKKRPFRVLFVFQTSERRNNAAERMLLLPNPIGNHSCLTTVDELVRAPLGKIWVTPRQYLMSTQYTSYEPSRRRNIVGYSRSAERERFVEERIVKVSLLH